MMTPTAEFSKYCITIFHVVKFILKSVKFWEQDTHENNARCTTKWKQKHLQKNATLVFLVSFLEFSTRPDWPR